jgi:glutamate carboxypeptidase
LNGRFQSADLGFAPGELSALRSEALKTAIGQRLPEYWQHLRRMVEINSFTLNRQGVNQVGNITETLFTPLGFECERHPSVRPEYGDHLFFKRPGTENRTIALISHLDTVYSPEEERESDFHWREEGDRVYGPGTNDIKGGTAMIWLILETLAAEFPVHFGRVNWQVMLNSSEEASSPDFAEHCEQRLEPDDTVACLVFESGAVDGKFCDVVTGRKGRAVATISVEGRGSHAGSAHDAGCNAIVKLAELITEVSRRTDYSTQTTINVGTVTGGTVVNTVAHFAETEVEMRTYSREAFNRSITFFESLATPDGRRDGEGFRIRVQIERDSMPWIAGEGSGSLLKTWQLSGKDVGLEVISKRRGGLSDANGLWRFAPTLDGLGPSGGNAHSSQRSADGLLVPEYIHVPSVTPKTLLNCLAILRLIEDV